MPKAILEFQLPEEQEEFELAAFGSKYRYALDNVREAFRRKAKYEENPATTWDDASELFWDSLREADVELG